MTLEVIQCVAAVVQGLGKVRPDRKGRVVAGQRLVVALQLEERKAAIAA